MILKNDLGFNEAMMGQVMSGQYLFGGLANAFILAPLTKLLGGEVSLLVRNCVFLMSTSYFAQAYLYGPGLSMIPEDLRGPIYIGLALFIAIFQYSLGTSITADTSRLVPKPM
jgi:hypothetical protein